MGMTFVDQVKAEKPALSLSLRRPRFLSAWRTARFALDPLLNSTASFRPWYAAKDFSNSKHVVPMLSWVERLRNSMSASLVSYSCRKVVFVKGIIELLPAPLAPDRWRSFIP